METGRNVEPAKKGETKTVLVGYMVIMSILTIDVLVTDGIGKSAVGPIGALVIGVMLWFRERESSTRD